MLQIFCTNGWRAHSSLVDTSCRYMTKYLATLVTPLHLIQNQEMSINTIINGRVIISESYQILHLSLYDGWDWILSKISIIVWWSKLQCSGKVWRYILHWRCRWCVASGCPAMWTPLLMGVIIVSISDECEGFTWQVGSYSDWWEKSMGTCINIHSCTDPADLSHKCKWHMQYIWLAHLCWRFQWYSDIWRVWVLQYWTYFFSFMT
jgi:hypothetical protein